MGGISTNPGTNALFHADKRSSDDGCDSDERTRQVKPEKGRRSLSWRPAWRPITATSSER